MHTDHIAATVSQLFRVESGKLTAVLTKIFGPAQLALAEDVVQDCMITALETWKYQGLPDNPQGWLYRVARNKAIDTIRKRKAELDLNSPSTELQLLQSGFTSQLTLDQLWEERSMKDDFLGMMFACCDPGISSEYQVTFILKILCGFSTKEIGRAFMVPEDTISKRLYRAKGFFRTLKRLPPVPSQADSEPRLDVILSTIYLIFNEGYCATHSENVIREKLISQALLLCRSLLEHPDFQQPKVYALAALICFHSARNAGRQGISGEILLLDEQDRSKWDGELISEGNNLMHQAAKGTSLSSYHLEAAIAFEHCTSPRFEQTNWNSILVWYDALCAQTNNSVYHLNRLIALCHDQGPEVAMDALLQQKQLKEVRQIHLYDGVLGYLHEQLGHTTAAEKHYQLARDLTSSLNEKNLYNHRIERLYRS